MKRIEALALAIARENNALEPGSEAFQTLNPGLLRSHSVDRVDPINSNGIRTFLTFQAGWQALLNNIHAKCAGRTQARGYEGRLTIDSTLADLIRTFRYVSARHIIDALQDALQDRAINERTKLGFFLEGLNGNAGNGHSSTADTLSAAAQ